MTFLSRIMAVQFHQEGIVVYRVIIRSDVGFAEEPVLRIVFQYFIDRTFQAAMSFQVVAGFG